MFGRKERVQETAHQAWVLAGTQAWTSLKSEIEADMEQSGQIVMPNASPEGAEVLVRMMARGGHPVESVWAEITDAMRADDIRSEIEKRLMFRQAIIAAGLLTGDEDKMNECLSLETNSLRLDEDD